MARKKALLAVALVVALAGPAGAPAAAPAGGRAAPGGKDLYGGPLPPKAVARLGTVRFRHPAEGWFLLGCAFSRDGKTLISVGGSDLRVWESATGRPLRRLTIRGLHVRGAGFSADRQLVALGGFTLPKENEPAVGLVRVLNVTTGKEVRTFSRGGARMDHTSLAFTPDGKTLASLDGDGVARLEEIATGAELLRHKFPVGAAASLALSPDGSRVAVASGQKLFVWDWQSGEEPREVKPAPRGTRSVDFSPDGKTLATGDNGQEGVCLWDVAGGRLLRRVGERGEWDTVRVRYSPDGRYLAATSSRRKALILYDPKSGKELRRLAPVGHPVFSPDSRRLAGWANDVLYVWDVATGKELGPGAAAHTQPPSFVRLLAGGTAVTAGDDGTVRFWDSSTGRQERKIEASDRWVRAAAVSPDGRWLATSELGEDHAVRLRDLRAGREVYRLAGHGRLGGRRALAFTPDGKRLASWGDDMYLRLWEVRNGKALLEHEVRPDGRPMPDEDDERMGKFRNFGDGVFSPDASLLVVEEGGFFVFDVKTGKQKVKFPNEGGYVIGLAVSPGGKHLLASSWGKQRAIKLTDGRTRYTVGDPLVCLYDIATGKVVRRISLPGDRIGPVAFSSDGKTFAAGTGGRIRLYATTTGAVRGTITGVPGSVRSLAFAPDGRRIIAGLSDTTAVVWDVPGK